MAKRITLDKAGRIVIPKPIPDALQLASGDAMEVDATDDGISLRPVRTPPLLVKEEGIWVYRTGSPLADMSLSDLIDQEREERSGVLLR